MRWLVLILLLVNGPVWAGPGALEAQVAADLIQSNYGLMLGLAIAAWGAWVFLINQKTWGVFMIILGVAVTAFPGLFVGMMQGAQPFIQAAGGTTPDPMVIGN